jgi:hypothetical protein
MENWEKIKVDTKVKPIHYENRKPVELIIGKEYYVSFGQNQARRCKLIKIDKDPERITVEIKVKSKSQQGYIDVDGNIIHYWVSTHTLFPDEIGLTPEEAVINEVTL